MIVLWGLINPQLSQKVMSLLKSDLQLFEEGRLDANHIDNLAGLGSNGVYSKHAWRDWKQDAATAKASQAADDPAFHEAHQTVVQNN